MSGGEIDTVTPSTSPSGSAVEWGAKSRGTGRRTFARDSAYLITPTNEKFRVRVRSSGRRIKAAKMKQCAMNAEAPA